MIRLTDNHGPRLKRLDPGLVIPGLADELEYFAGVIVDDAAESIRADSISGKGHVPAPEGSPPNADTHDLDESIHVGGHVETPGVLQNSAVADSDHAYYQERGTSRMGARPFLEPATERAKPDFLEALTGRIRESYR